MKSLLLLKVAQVACAVLLFIHYAVCAQERIKIIPQSAIPQKMSRFELKSKTNIASYSIYVYLTADLSSATHVHTSSDTFDERVRLTAPLLGADIYRVEMRITKTDPSPASIYSLDFYIKPELVGDPLYSSFVFGDPHVTIPLPNSTRPICFDITGYDGEVIQLMSVNRTGIIINAKLLDPFHNKTSRPENLFIGEVAILSKGSTIHVTPELLTIKNKTSVRWREGATSWFFLDKHLKIKISRLRVRIPIGAGIHALIHRKSRTRLDVTFDNLYAEFEEDLGGFIGSVARKIVGHKHFKRDDGTHAIILKYGDEEIVANGERLGKVKCWKVYNPWKRFFKDDPKAMRRPCLFCRT